MSSGTRDQPNLRPRTNHPSVRVPRANKVSPNTRIHLRVSINPEPRNSSLRAYHRPWFTLATGLQHPQGQQAEERHQQESDVD